MDQHTEPQGDADPPSHSAQTGWIRGHVHVGDSYAQVGVRFTETRRLSSSVPSNDDIVEVTRYATALARALADRHSPPNRLDVEVVREHRAPDGPLDLTLRLQAEAPNLTAEGL